MNPGSWGSEGTPGAPALHYILYCKEGCNRDSTLGGCGTLRCKIFPRALNKIRKFLWLKGNILVAENRVSVFIKNLLLFIKNKLIALIEK